MVSLSNHCIPYPVLHLTRYSLAQPFGLGADIFPQIIAGYRVKASKNHPNNMAIT